jgi:hypothetical protein
VRTVGCDAVRLGGLAIERRGKVTAGSPDVPERDAILFCDGDLIELLIAGATLNSRDTFF